jgi:ppGpp synthetase/RelA/SpoT-type nucleotidyltranferase
MNLDEYEKSGQAHYQRLAQVVESILKHALAKFDGVANPPQSQRRAKDVQSLRNKLGTDVSSMEIEAHIKDLAGCRLIFYTATDLERFLQTDVWTTNFEIDRAASKIHFPRSEESTVDELYQGIHYVVRLKPERTKLIEYADLAGLRCEVQLQTILNHAWSETAHDVIYKGRQASGFGTRQHDALRARFAQVMRKYLIPAGYEMQKIQSDAERLQVGRAVFDSNALAQLAAATDNNGRLDILEKIKTHLLPGLDDPKGYVNDIRNAVVSAIEDSRTTPLIAREGFMGNVRAAKPQHVLLEGLEILDVIRYTSIEEAFLKLIRLWDVASDPQEKVSIEANVQKLAAYYLPIWDTYGAGVQLALLAELDRFGSDRRRAIRPLILLVCRAALSTEMNHSKQSGVDTITFSKATVSTHSSLAAARSQAAKLAFEALSASTTADEWRTA